MAEQQRGSIIVFEGPEGAGKTTQSRLLYDWCVDHQIPAVKAIEPGGTLLGQEIRAILLQDRNNDQIDPRAELLLFYAARLQNLKEVVNPSIKDGKLVIFDRFEGSSFAYQGVARGLGVKAITDLSRMFVQPSGCIPDLYLFLDVPPGLGLKRKLGEDINRFERENLTFHNRVRQGYFQLYRGIRDGKYRLAQHAEIIDATMPQDIIHKMVVNQVIKLLGREDLFL